MILRNVSGAPATLHAANASNIADNALWDTATIVDGLPQALAPSLQASAAVYKAVASGDWVVVVDGQDLSTTQSLAAITSASVGEGDGAAWRIVPAQALAKNTGLVLLSVSLAANEGCPVKVAGEIEFERDTATLGKSLCVVNHVSFIAYHRSNGSKVAVKPSSEVTTDEDLRFSTDFSGDDARLLVSCKRSAGTISASLRVCSRVVTLS